MCQGKWLQKHKLNTFTMITSLPSIVAWKSQKIKHRIIEAIQVQYMFISNHEVQLLKKSIRESKTNGMLPIFVWKKHFWISHTPLFGPLSIWFAHHHSLLRLRSFLLAQADPPPRLQGPWASPENELWSLSWSKCTWKLTSGPKEAREEISWGRPA